MFCNEKLTADPLQAEGWVRAFVSLSAGRSRARRERDLLARLGYRRKLPTAAEVRYGAEAERERDR